LNTKKWNVLSLAFLVVVISACSTGSGELAVEGVWARPGLANGNTAVYFIVNNPTGETERLLAARGEVAEKIELHLSAMNDDGVMKMQMQKDIPIPANDSVELKQGGLHVMLINLEAPLEVGDSFDLTLEFEKAGNIQLVVPVEER
jgi:copper(I)-binding protein